MSRRPALTKSGCTQKLQGASQLAARMRRRIRSPVTHARTPIGSLTHVQTDRRMFADVLLLRGRDRRNLPEPAAGGAGNPRLRPGAVGPLPAKDAMPPAAPNGRPARSPPPPFTSAAGARAAAGPAAALRRVAGAAPRRRPPSPPPSSFSSSSSAHCACVCAARPPRSGGGSSSLPFPPPPPPRPARPPQRGEEREGNREPPPPPGRTGPTRAALPTLGRGHRRLLLRAGPRAAHGKWAAGPRARSSARAAPTHGCALFLWNTLACVCIYTHTPHRLSAWAVFRRGCPCRRDCVYYMFLKGGWMGVKETPPPRFPCCGQALRAWQECTAGENKDWRGGGGTGPGGTPVLSDWGEGGLQTELPVLQEPTIWVHRRSWQKGLRAKSAS